MLEGKHGHGRLVYDRSNIGMAVFSSGRLHRYLLTRNSEFLGCGNDGPVVCFGMQNPSKAGANESDPTITRVVGFARRMGAARLFVVNMAAGIATKPADLLRMEDPVGPHNTYVIQTVTAAAGIRVAAWGALTPKLRKLMGPSIVEFTRHKPVKCLGKTKNGGGDPRHPLYLRADTPLVDWP